MQTVLKFFLPKTSFSKGNFAPVNEENESILIIDVDGRIPEDLEGGQYIRNGSNPLFTKKGKSMHWFGIV